MFLLTLFSELGYFHGNKDTFLIVELICHFTKQKLFTGVRCNVVFIVANFDRTTNQNIVESLLTL